METPDQVGGQIAMVIKIKKAAPNGAAFLNNVMGIRLIQDFTHLSDTIFDKSRLVGCFA